jgi:hypothetical protein
MQKITFPEKPEKTREGKCLSVRIYVHGKITAVRQTAYRLAAETYSILMPISILKYQKLRGFSSPYYGRNYYFDSSRIYSSMLFISEFFENPLISGFLSRYTSQLIRKSLAVFLFRGRCLPFRTSSPSLLRKMAFPL